MSPLFLALKKMDDIHFALILSCIIFCLNSHSFLLLQFSSGNKHPKHRQPEFECKRPNFLDEKSGDEATCLSS